MATSPQAPPEPAVDKTSGWAPLANPAFRNRTIASVVSNIGSWMQDTAGTWLMTVLTASPLLIALMQTAASLPVLLLGLPAGATADIFDRRRLLMFWQGWMLVAALALCALSLFGVISPWTLLGLTFLLNIGSAMNNPAWQAIVPELVPHSELPDAIAINSAGYNLARAVGPALGGLAMAAFVSVHRGAGAVFALNAASFIAVILVLYVWKRTPLFKSALPSERMWGSMRGGIRYLRHAPALQSVLVRAVAFTGCVSAMWALLAVVAQRDLHKGAFGYGVLNGCLGVGAVVGASSLPKLRRRFAPDHIILVAAGVLACTLTVLALAANELLVILALLLSGFAWTVTTSSFNVAVQLSVPAWVQARALGLYQMIFQGGMALGSALWGAVAERSSTPTALCCAAAGLLLTFPLSKRFPLLRGSLPDLSPYTLNRQAPEVVIELHPEDGPVLVTVDYNIAPENYPKFSHAIHQLRDIRLRDGAIRWGVFQDTAQPSHIRETFVMESWVDYLRARERLTASDREIQKRVWSFMQDGALPKATHMIYAREYQGPERPS